MHHPVTQPAFRGWLLVGGRFGERVGKQELLCVQEGWGGRRQPPASCLALRVPSRTSQERGDPLGHGLFSHRGDGVTHGAGSLQRRQGWHTGLGGCGGDGVTRGFGILWRGWGDTWAWDSAEGTGVTRGIGPLWRRQGWQAGPGLCRGSRGDKWGRVPPERTVTRRAGLLGEGQGRPAGPGPCGGHRSGTGGDPGAGSSARSTARGPAPRGPRPTGTPIPHPGPGSTPGTHRSYRLRTAPRPAARKRLARRRGRGAEAGGWAAPLRLAPPWRGRAGPGRWRSRWRSRWGPGAPKAVSVPPLRLLRPPAQRRPRSSSGPGARGPGGASPKRPSRRGGGSGPEITAPVSDSKALGGMTGSVPGRCRGRVEMLGQGPDGSSASSRAAEGDFCWFSSFPL